MKDRAGTRWPFPIATALCAMLASGCASPQNLAAGGSPSLPAAKVKPLSGTAGEYIKHVIVIVQENRSFENFFAGYPGANAPMYGYGKTNSGHRIKIPLQEISLDNDSNLPHTYEAAIKMWDNGAMDGFSKFGGSRGHPPYEYVAGSYLKPYWTMAKEYVLADEMFPTEMGPSWTAHLTLVAGTDNLNPRDAEVDFPSHPPEDCDAPPGTTSDFLDQYRIIHYRLGPFPCFTQFRTLADTLDAAGISWRYYQTKLYHAGIWAPFEAIADVRYGPDYTKDIGYPPATVLTDIAQGRLAGVTWVSPTKEDSDHPAKGTDRGPSWVASIVNAVGESKFWNSTAIVVVWDDWGGWYDNAVPPQLDNRGLGIRVPCLIVSSYAKQGYVSHTQYEWGSIIKFIEQVFDLPPLGSEADGYTDTRANSIVDSFDFDQGPRAFTPITTKYKARDFLHEPAAWLKEPVDDE